MIHYWSNWFILFPLALSMYIAMRLSVGSTDSQRKSLLGSVVRSSTVMLMWFAFMAVGFRGWLGFVWLFLIALLGLVLFRKRRRLERNVMLYAAMNVQQPASQAALMEYFCQEPVGQLPRIAHRVLSDIGGGIQWGRTLEKRRVGRGVYEVLSLRMLDRYGRRDSSTLQSGERTPLQIEAEVERLLARFSVFFWVLLAAPIIMLLLTFIVPTFNEILDEFGIEVPFAFTLFRGTGSMIAVAIAFLSLSILAIGAVVIAVWLSPRLLQAWPMRLFCGDYFRSVGFSALGLVSQHEPNLASLFSSTSDVVPVDFVARQYALVATKVDQGQPLPSALVDSRLLSRRELQAFRFDLSGPDAIWALRQYASWRVERMLNRYSLFVQLLVVGLTLVLAGVVGFIGYAFFGVLSQMIVSGSTFS